MSTFTHRLGPGNRVHVSGDSAELGISDYNIRVDTDATVLKTPEKYAKKVLISLDYIDHESNVMAYVSINKLMPPRYNNQPPAWTLKNALECMAGARACLFHANQCPYWREDSYSCDSQKAAEDALAYMRELEAKLACAELAYAIIPEADYYYHRPEVGEFKAVYHNPDADAGGQFVVLHLPYELILKAKSDTDMTHEFCKNLDEVREFFRYLDENAKIELADLGTQEYKEILETYVNPHPDYVGRNQKTMEALVEQAISTKDKQEDI